MNGNRVFKTALLAVLCFTSPRQGHSDEPLSAAGSDRPAVEAGGKARHVLLVVWDGLRPDLIRNETTPFLAKLAREGTFFANHHSIYPTSTEVNGTALATGCFPQRSGIIGNREYWPEIEPARPVDTQDLKVIRKGDELTGGKYLAVPTIAEILQEAGKPVVVAGTKPVAWLMNRSPRQVPGTDIECVSVVDGKSLPEDSLETVTAALDRYPREGSLPNTVADGWTRRALTEVLWRKGVPPLSVLWLSEPDYSQHGFGIASPTALGGLASSDAQLAAALAVLESKGVAAQTDVIVVSDHGFSSISEALDIKRALTTAGFPIHDRYTRAPQSGDILVNNLGGSIFFYVAEHDAAMIKRLVEFFQGSAFAGPILTRDNVPGTFPLALAHIETARAPDVVLTLRWTEEKNGADIPGTTISGGDRKPGQGTHATLSPYDVHNTCVAAGPDFRRGCRVEAPSSNVDIAPTVAWILGGHFPRGTDGRVLRDGLADYHEGSAPGPSRTERTEATVDLAVGRWQQYLQTTSYDGETYIDQGNATLVPAKH